MGPSVQLQLELGQGDARAHLPQHKRARNRSLLEVSESASRHTTQRVDGGESQ